MFLEDFERFMVGVIKVSVNIGLEAVIYKVKTPLENVHLPLQEIIGKPFLCLAISYIRRTHGL